MGGKDPFGLKNVFVLRFFVFPAQCGLVPYLNVRPLTATFVVTDFVVENKLLVFLLRVNFAFHLSISLNL